MEPDDVRQQWTERSAAYSPGYYAYYGPDERSERLRTTLDAAVDRDDAVLEVGCSSGRHLAHLHDHGYTDLHGIEINDDALEVMRSNYPDLAATGTFHLDAVENVVADFVADRFDAVYSVETLQHIHPDDDWVFAELARVAAEVLVTVENEGDGPGSSDEGNGNESDDPSSGVSMTYVDGIPLYYRKWDDLFGSLGFVEVESRPFERATLREFRPDR